MQTTKHGPLNTLDGGPAAGDGRERQAKGRRPEPGDLRLYERFVGQESAEYRAARRRELKRQRQAAAGNR